MRDNTKLIAVGRATPAFAKSQIQVYSSAGEGLLLISVDAFLVFYALLWLIRCQNSGSKAGLYALDGP